METGHPISPRPATLLFGAALISLVVAGCSDDGGSTGGTGGEGGSTTQGTGGATTTSQGGATGSGGDTGSGGGLGDPQFEGSIWIETELKVGNVYDATSYGLFWEVGSASGPVDEWYDLVIGSGAPLAEGECALITEGAMPSFTPLSVGPTAKVKDRSSTLIELALEPSDTSYYGDAGDTVADALHTAPFTLAIDPGTGTIPPLTSQELGPLVDMTVPTNASCTIVNDCALSAAPSAPVDDMFFLFDLTYVCRGNPTTGDFVLTTDVLASDGDNQANVQAYAVKRVEANLGASTVDVNLITRHQFLVDLQ